MNLRAALRCFPDESGLQTPPGGRHRRQGCPCLLEDSVASLPCKLSTHPERPRPTGEQLLSQSDLRGSAPCRSRG
jgi:hypothetical protein